MRTLRSNIINIYAFIGIISVILLLLNLTGFLFGILTPERITMFLASTAVKMSGAIFTWWVSAAIGWFAACWTILYLIRTRTHPPIQIKQDDIGAVEVHPDDGSTEDLIYLPAVIK